MFDWIPAGVTLAFVFLVTPSIYLLLKRKLEQDMDTKIKEAQKENEQKFASKEEAAALTRDMKTIVGLFEKIDYKLDRFFAMKPPG